MRPLPAHECLVAGGSTAAPLEDCASEALRLDLDRATARVSDLEGLLSESERDKQDMSRNLVDAYNSISSLRCTNSENLKRLAAADSKASELTSALASAQDRVTALENSVSETEGKLRFELKCRQECEKEVRRPVCESCDTAGGLATDSSFIGLEERCRQAEELCRENRLRLAETEERLGQLESCKLSLQTRLSSSACILLDAESRLTEVHLTLAEYESQMVMATRQLLQAESQRQILLLPSGCSPLHTHDTAEGEGKRGGELLKDDPNLDMASTSDLLQSSVGRLRELEQMVSDTQSRLTRIRTDLVAQD